MKAIALLLACFAVWAIFAATNSPSETPQVITPEQLAAQAAAKKQYQDNEIKNTETRFEACRTKLQKAKKLDVLYALDWKLPREPYVVAGPTFMAMPIDGKEGFADVANCFLVGGKADSCVNFDVLHWQSGRAVGRFENCKLRMN